MRRFLATQTVLWILLSSGTVLAEIEQSEVLFTSGDVELAGTVFTPFGEGPFPAIVLVHGSGPGERSEYLSIATRFAGEGMVVLIYDKRGSGHSGGNWITSSLTDLAEDAAAALRFLVDQPKIDSQRSGYWGISQGGWIVPLAANMSYPAFAIVVSGGGLTPKEVESVRYRSIVRHANGSQADVDKAESLVESYFDYLGGLISYETLQQKIEPVKTESWFDAMGIGNVIPGPENRSNWEWVATFDPKESIEELAMPILVFLGGIDPLTPAGDAARAWRAALSPDIQQNRVVVFQDAGHGMRTGAHGGDYAEGYFSTQFDWLRAIGVL